MSKLVDFKYSDPGDKFDKVKWDFSEVDLDMIMYDNIPYSVLDHSSIKILHPLRLLTNRLCDYLIYHYQDYSEYNKLCIDIFLYIHKDGNYILSQIPHGTNFEGINKPRGRYISNCPHIGPDKNLRAQWRHIFLNLDGSKEDILSLYIHELAHTMQNCVRFRVDDHGEDFTVCENILKHALEFC